MKPNPVRVYQAQNDSSDGRYFSISEKNLTNLAKCTIIEKTSLHSSNGIFLHKHSSPSVHQLFQWQSEKSSWTTMWPNPKINLPPTHTPKYVYRYIFLYFCRYICKKKHPCEICTCMNTRACLRFSPWGYRCFWSYTDFLKIKVLKMHKVDLLRM